MLYSLVKYYPYCFIPIGIMRNGILGLVFWVLEVRLIYCRDTHLHKICVHLFHQDSSLNQLLCQEIGLSPCVSAEVCRINPRIILDAYDKEKCLLTLFSFFSTFTCNDNKVKEYIYNTENGTTVYVDKEITNLLWKSCSRRSRLRLSYLFQDGPKQFCKSLTLGNSKVKIRQAINLPGLSKILPINLEQLAEINWLMGSPISWDLLRVKISGVLIILFIIFLSVSTLFIRQGRSKNKLTEPDVIF
uniref:Uncharacterized protein n=1 Tax=Theileria parva TaxID=5875 RepID=Q4N901_THEPA|eukprot:XP_765840.1 hypothetical protein [Theileria parva strain Muguga]